MSSVKKPGAWVYCSRLFSVCFTGLVALSYLLFDQQSALAEVNEVVVDIPVYDQSVSVQSLTGDAELIVSDTIDQYFGQNPEFNSIQVVVLASRNGETIPILTTSVSRIQWQQQRDVSVWSRYYNAAYGLLQRRDDPVMVATARSSQSEASSNVIRASQIDRALDQGQLTGAAAQQVLSEID